MRAARKTIKTTCPRDCYDACGMKVLIEDGRVRKVSGDRDHLVSRGKLCPKCALAYNGAWIDPARRLTWPLRRAGAKGEGRFVPTTWDDAIAAITQRLQAVLSAHGPKTILHTHYTGTCSAIAGNFPSRFFNRLGATEVDPDTVCNKAGHEALKYVFGDSLTGFDPRTAKDAACVLVWGANPSASAPHAHTHWLPETSATKIVVDPIAHATATSADLFLQPRPGTDAALAFAMMNAVMAAGLVRSEFIAEHVVGWERMLVDVEAMTPERGEALTGVPAGLIRQAALTYARGPSLLWLGQGMQRQRYGGNAFRSVAALCAVTGNLGRPGAGFLYMNGPSTRGVSFDYVAAPQSAAGRGQPDQPNGPGGAFERRRQVAGAVLLEQQHRRLQSAAVRAARAHCGARICCMSSSICSRPIPPTMRISYCRRRASSSSTTWCFRISITPYRRRSPSRRRRANACRTRRSFAGWRARSASPSPSCFSPTPR